MFLLLLMKINHFLNISIGETLQHFCISECEAAIRSVTNKVAE
jgi:hypothetical protein